MSARTESRRSVGNEGEFSFSVGATRDERYEVVYCPSSLSIDNAGVRGHLDDRRGIVVVTTPSVERLYGEQLRRYLAAHCQGRETTLVVLPCSEQSKDMEQVLSVCKHAAAAGLERRSRIVSFGGGVLMDITGLAAALFRRGIPHLRIPTTLIGMIDAGIGVKHSVNFRGTKSLLGGFSAPEACVVDPRFLETLPARHLRCGLAESVKVALAGSRRLFELLESWGPELLQCSFRGPTEAVREVIRGSIAAMLAELRLNLFERAEVFGGSYARRADFGHTFSPYIEEASRHEVLHGEAVAVDIALSAEISNLLGLLGDDELHRVRQLLRALGLRMFWPGTELEAMCASLTSVVRHRDGQLNLVVPTAIGTSTFLGRLGDVPPPLLREALRRLAERDAADEESVGGA